MIFFMLLFFFVDVSTYVAMYVYVQYLSDHPSSRQSLGLALRLTTVSLDNNFFDAYRISQYTCTIS